MSIVLGSGDFEAYELTILLFITGKTRIDSRFIQITPPRARRGAGGSNEYRPTSYPGSQRQTTSCHSRCVLSLEQSTTVSYLAG